MILASINGHPSYVHRVSRLDKYTAPKDGRPITEQFRSALLSAQRNGVKISGGTLIAMACPKCSKLYAAGDGRQMCSDCETAGLRKGERKITVIGRFTCAYCKEESDQVRKNQATCQKTECVVAHGRKKFESPTKWRGTSFNCHNCGCETEKFATNQIYCAPCRPKMKLKLEEYRREQVAKGRKVLKRGTIFNCEKCGGEAVVKGSGQRYCDPCAVLKSLERKRAKSKQKRDARRGVSDGAKVDCIDCGASHFKTSPNQKRCEVCREKHRIAYSKTYAH